jgi:predicted ATPase
MATTPTTQAEQLELLPVDDVPTRFRMSERTRRIGLAGVARSREILEARRRERLHAEQAEREARLPRHPGKAA